MVMAVHIIQVESQQLNWIPVNTFKIHEKLDMEPLFIANSDKLQIAN